MQGPCITTQICRTPCGELLLGSFEGKLCLCDWCASPHHPRVLARLQRLLAAPLAESDRPTLRLAAEALAAYFAGHPLPFTLPLLMVGTEFQQKVWQALQHIPLGETLSYAELAQAMGQPRATRAVANAVGANAMSIIIPCHRIVGSAGRLGGYAGGPAAKRFLLEHEEQLRLRQQAP